MGGPVALSGTPGTGKTATARRLGARFRTVEVLDLARAHGALVNGRDGTTVDLTRLSRAVRTPRVRREFDIVVGHLAHLLPLEEAIVLRCHPLELRRRLERAKRGTPAERQENLVCEATDVVLLEAVAARRRVFEIDTTGRSTEAVARAVGRRVREDGPPRWGTVDWLSDPSVTAHLLDRPR